MNDVYQTPESELVTAAQVGEHGSVETAVLGNYEFNIGDVFSEAWSKVNGNKLKVFLCSLVFWIVLIVLDGVTNLPAIIAAATGSSSSVLFTVLATLGEIVYFAISTPISIGFGFIGVRMAMGAPFSPGSLFVFFPQTIKLALAYLLVAIVIVFGFLLLIIPGIYLAVAYYYALYLMADKELGIWEAMEISRKATTKRWFAFLGFHLLLFLILVISALPLFIPLIWTVPFALTAWGIAYRNMFGVKAETLARQ